MLTVGPNLSSFTLAAGEPFLLWLALQEVDGSATSLTGRAFVLSFFKDDRTPVAKIDGEVSSDGTFLRFEEDGTFCEGMFNQVINVELNERLRNGHNRIAGGRLAVTPSAQSVASLDNGPIGEFVVRVVAKKATAVGDKLAFSQSVVAYVAPGATPTPSPTVTLSAAQSKQEGNSGATLLQYTVTRSSTVGAVNVPWSFAAGSTDASDYTGGTLPSGGTVAMADGVASGTITISVNGDATVEPDEQFTVSIAAPAGYAAGSAMSATGTILNDDSAPQLTLTGPLTYATNAASGTLIANIGNVPAGITPTITPGDGREVIAGDATNGWKIVVGMTASSAGKISTTVAATGATSVTKDVTVTAPTAAAYPSGAKAKWDAADLSALADGAAVTSWTDSVSGAVNNQSGGGGAPTYKASALGGKPGVKFNGNQRLSGTGSTALNNVTSSGTYSIVLVQSGIDWTNSQAKATAFSSYTGNGQYRPVSAGSQGPGYQDDFSSGAKMDAGLHVAVFQSAQGNSEQFHFFDGTAFRPGSAGFTFSNDFCLGGYSNDYGEGFFKGTLHKVFFYDRLLSQVEVLQIQKAACDDYSQPYPWAGKSCFHAYFGDSLTFGLSASSPNASYPNKAAAALNRPFGTYTGLGFVGYAYGLLENEAQKHIDGISAITGIPTALPFFEWYNEARGTAMGDVHAATNTFIQNRKNADPTIKIVLGTSTDANSSEIQSVKADRAKFNGYFDAAANRTGLAGYAPIHNNANIGVAGAAAASGASTYFQSDLIHLTDAGYAELAGIFTAAINAAGLAT